IETHGAEAQESADTLNTFGRVVPAILGILGVISLAAGVFLGVRGGRARTASGSRARPATAPDPLAPRPDPLRAGGAGGGRASRRRAWSRPRPPAARPAP